MSTLESYAKIVSVVGARKANRWMRVLSKHLPNILKSHSQVVTVVAQYYCKGFCTSEDVYLLQEVFPSQVNLLRSVLSEGDVVEGAMDMILDDLEKEYE